MDAATAAAVAALVVAVLAMTIAFAQMIQQYLITGQLIRICDSVVYGKMPGQGRRVWQKSQFRFRVVYSIPQIHLRADLWNGESDDLEREKDEPNLPDLRHTTDKAIAGLSWWRQDSGGLQKRSAYSAVPGEACWVSLCRMAQHSVAKELYYEMVDGDSDRCPSDLSVVPMQVSMRDVITICLMAGMKCTDASFERRYLAMEGTAGSITSSVHPILGSLIRFTPRRSHKAHGLRISDGSLPANWMTRMWDVITIAGRQYSMQERKYYEAYEVDTFIAVSRDLTLFGYTGPRLSSRASSLAAKFRSTRQSIDSDVLRQHFAQTPDDTSVNGDDADANKDEKLDRSHISISRSPQDGDWSFETDQQDTKILPKVLVSQSLPVSDKSSQPNAVDGGDDYQGPDFDNTSSNISRATTQLGNISLSANVVTGTNGAASPFQAGEVGGFSRMGHRKHLDGSELQEYIKDKRNATPSSSNRDNLLLCWPESGPSENFTNDSSHSQQDNDWRTSYAELKRKRSRSYAERWRDILDTRQQRRNDRDMEDEWEFISLSSSRPSSIRPESRLGRDRSAHSRSGSRQSRGSRRDSRSSVYRAEEFRGRTRHRFASGLESSERSVSPGDRTTEYDETTVTYGTEPVQSHVDGNGEVSKNEDHSATGKTDATSKRKPVVNFQLDEPDRSPSPRPARKANRTRFVSDDNIDEKVSVDRRQALGEQPEHQNEKADERAGGSTAALKRQHFSPTPEKRKVQFDQDPNLDNADSESLSDSDNKPGTTEPQKSILKAPRTQFPEDPNPIREGIAPFARKDIPSGAKWTKIDRRLVNPEALEEGQERFEEREDYVIVLRVLTRQEIERYAARTAEIRGSRTTERAPSPYPQRTRSEIVSTDSTDHIEQLPSQSQKPTNDYALNDDSLENEGSSGKFTRPLRVKLASPKTELTMEDKATDGSTTREANETASAASISENWSNESTFGSNRESHISESPTAMSEDEEDVVDSPRRRLSIDTSGMSKESFRKTIPPKPLYTPSLDREFNRQKSPPYRVDWAKSKISSESVKHSQRPEYSHRSTASISPRPQSELDPRDRMDQVSEKDYNEHLNIESRDPVNKGTDSQTNGVVNWFWICQADVIPGYFATPWQRQFSESICSGAIAVMRAALEGFTDNSSLVYVDSLPDCEAWVHKGKSTHPCYGINAMGGIIVSAKYKRVKFDHLATHIPPIQLLRYPNGKSQDPRPSPMTGNRNSDRTIINRLSELMALDSWLSFCGRLPEIYDGRSRLIQTMPTLIQKIMTDFAYEFENVDRTAGEIEGGWQLIAEMGELLLDEMEDKLMLDEAEQLFTIAAILRAAKMALCVSQGPSTAMVQDILLRDAQVYLV